MGQVTVTLNGRTYRLRCDDGEEARLFALAEYVRGKVDSLVGEFGQAGDDRLLLMAALLITDELYELRDLLAESRQGSGHRDEVQPADPGWRRSDPAGKARAL